VTRILIADDHEVVRSELRSILAAQPNWEVAAEAADGKAAIFRAIETTPDIAVLDHSLPLVNGLEVARQIRARLPKTEVLVFTMQDNATLIQEVCSRIPAQVGRRALSNRRHRVSRGP
jgi:DNA-binding NarL/FixJ family response regulator